MSRAADADLRLVRMREVLARLGNISHKTFQRNWAGVFSPRRANGQDRAHGSPRVVLSDELDAAVLGGAPAVLTLRRRKGRLEQEAA